MDTFEQKLKIKLDSAVKASVSPDTWGEIAGRVAPHYERRRVQSGAKSGRPGRWRIFTASAAGAVVLALVLFVALFPFSGSRKISSLLDAYRVFNGAVKTNAELSSLKYDVKLETDIGNVFWLEKEIGGEVEKKNQKISYAKAGNSLSTRFWNEEESAFSFTEYVYEGEYYNVHGESGTKTEFDGGGFSGLLNQDGFALSWFETYTVKYADGKTYLEFALSYDDVSVILDEMFAVCGVEPAFLETLFQEFSYADSRILLEVEITEAGCVEKIVFTFSGDIEIEGEVLAGGIKITIDYHGFGGGILKDSLETIEVMDFQEFKNLYLSALTQTAELEVFSQGIVYEATGVTVTGDYRVDGRLPRSYMETAVGDVISRYYLVEDTLYTEAAGMKTYRQFPYNTNSLSFEYDLPFQYLGAGELNRYIFYDVTSAQSGGDTHLSFFYRDSSGGLENSVTLTVSGGILSEYSFSGYRDSYRWNAEPVPVRFSVRTSTESGQIPVPDYTQFGQESFTTETYKDLARFYENIDFEYETYLYRSNGYGFERMSRYVFTSKEIDGVRVYRFKNNNAESQVLEAYYIDGIFYSKAGYFNEIEYKAEYVDMDGFYEKIAMLTASENLFFPANFTAVSRADFYVDSMPFSGAAYLNITAGEEEWPTGINRDFTVTGGVLGSASHLDLYRYEGIDMEMPDLSPYGLTEKLRVTFSGDDVNDVFADAGQGRLFALSDNGIYVLDAAAMRQIHYLPYREAGAMLCYQNTVFIALPDRIVLIDRTDFSEKREYARSGAAIGQMFCDGTYLYWITDETFSMISRMHLGTEEQVYQHLGVHEAVAAINPEAHLLYIANRNLTSAEIYYLDTRLMSVRSELLTREVVLDGDLYFDGEYVYYNGDKYDALQAEIVGQADSPVKTGQQFIDGERLVVFDKALRCLYGVNFEMPVITVALIGEEN